LKTVITKKVQSVPSPAAHGATLALQVAIAKPDVKEVLIQQASLNSDSFDGHQQQASKFVIGLALVGTCGLLISPFADSAVATDASDFSKVSVLPIVSAVSKEDVYMQQLRQNVSSLRTQNQSANVAFTAPRPKLVAQLNKFTNRQVSNVGYVIPVNASTAIEIPVPAPRSFNLKTAAPQASQIATNSATAVQSNTEQTTPPVGMMWPARGAFTSGYGRRWGRMHKGIDIAAPVGTPIVAVADGVVTVSGWDAGGFGKRIDIQHADGTRTLYGHNSRLLVAVGQHVKQGQQISAMGSTGRSTGPHLHFEFHSTGGNAVNPIAYLTAAPRT
jgi:murein DD-endopeptidase MepM/ murein hydrolase activator NlpD